jgi:hypothetical protein
VDPDVPKIHRLVRRALETADTSATPAPTATATPTPSASSSGSGKPKPSPSPTDQGAQAVDVNQVC